MIAMSKTVPSDDLGASAETYGDVEKLICRLCWKAVRRHGGEFDDYRSAANEAYCDAYASFDPARGAAFATHLWWQVRGAISRVVHQTSIQERTVAAGEDIDLDVLPGRRRFDLTVFRSELSGDAREVVNMVVESPNEVWDLLHHRDIGSCVRGGLIRRLRDLGWTVARVAESFEEIREALG